jgi:hypothetical protein
MAGVFVPTVVKGRRIKASVVAGVRRRFEGK